MNTRSPFPASMILLIALSFLMTGSLSAQEKPVKVYILAGQSNMDGYGGLEALDWQIKEGDPDRKKVFASGTELAVILRKNGVPGDLRGTLDICRTPLPGGPVPIPYPTGVETGRLEAELHRSGYPNVRLRDPATDKIRIGDKEIALKGPSVFHKSTGDEVGTAGGIKSSFPAKARRYPPWVAPSGGR